MKFASALLYSVLSPFFLHAQGYDRLPEQKDRKYYQLKGAVQQLSEKQWRPSPDSLVVYRTKEIVPDASYILEHTGAINFDTTGNIQSIQSSDPDERKHKGLKQTGRSFYYSHSRLSAVRMKEEEHEGDSLAFAYRKNGLIDHYSLYNDKNELQYTMSYVYKNGRLFTARKNNAENFPVSLVRYKYDKGQLKETQHFDEQFRLWEIRRYSMQVTGDKHKNESYSVSDAQGKIKEGMSQVKDSLGRVLEQNAINSNREVTEYKSFRYDERGFPVEEKTVSPGLELTVTNRYTYDEQGNWIRKESFQDDRLRSVTLRELKYF